MNLEDDTSLATIADEVRSCTLCDLCQTRRRAVPGEGNSTAEVMFIGEAPGYNEDASGRPFVGPAGQLLDELLASINLDRKTVFITNVVKCRPPKNRDPFPKEIATCEPYLERQIAALKPKIIVTLGRYSMAKFFAGASISKIHGEPRLIKDIVYVPMYHPAAALHRADLLNDVRADMQRLATVLDAVRRSPEDVARLFSTSVLEETPMQLGLFD